MEEVSSSVPIPESGLGIDHHQEEEEHDEEVVQVKGHGLQDVAAGYSSEEENPSDHVVADLPTAVLLAVELVGVAEDLPLEVPCGADVAVPQGAPLEGEGHAWIPSVAVVGPGSPRAYVEVLGWVEEERENEGDRGVTGGEGEGDPSDWDSEEEEWGEALGVAMVPATWKAS